MLISLAVIHPNGHGHVADQAEASPAAYVDAGSRVLDSAWVTSGRLVDSTVALNCRVTDDAQIIRSIVSCDHVAGATVIESGLFDQVRVSGAAYLFRVKAKGGARVYGDARIIGGGGWPVHLWGDMRILAGTWHRSPLYQHLGFCFLTEGPPGWAMVDCKFNSYDGWFRVGERFARRWYGWSPEKLSDVRRVFRLWADSEELRGKHWGRCVPGCASPDAFTC